jgi:hypothetical protein
VPGAGQSQYIVFNRYYEDVPALRFHYFPNLIVFSWNSAPIPFKSPSDGPCATGSPQMQTRYLIPHAVAPVF